MVRPFFIGRWFLFVDLHGLPIRSFPPKHIRIEARQTPYRSVLYVEKAYDVTPVPIGVSQTADD